MSELAERDRVARRGWAAPGGSHDRLIRLLKIGLPAAVGIILAFLAFAPLERNREFSFVLDKNKAQHAEERMRATAAQYRGEDNKGRPFVLDARSAVQRSSAERVVDIRGMTARMDFENGPAMLVADRGRYDLDDDLVDVVGPIRLTGADGYRMNTSDVRVNLRERRMASRGPVEGRIPLGTFSANQLQVELGDRKVILTGGAHLHIVQGRGPNANGQR
jgi:lipopolysaccharide export system protein LptC